MRKEFLLFSVTFFIICPNLKAEWEVGIFFGKASTSKSDLKIVQPSRKNDLLFHDIEFKDKSFSTPLYYGIRGAYFFNSYPNFGLEAEFIHAKIHSNASQMVFVSGIRKDEPIDSTIRLGDIVQGFSMTHGFNFLFFNLVGRYRFDKVKVCGRLGLGPLIPHTESVIDNIKREQYEIHFPAYQLALGSEIDFWKGVCLLLEYKYTYVEVKDAKIAYGHAEMKGRTRHLVFGLTTRF